MPRKLTASGLRVKSNKPISGLHSQLLITVLIALVATALTCAAAEGDSSAKLPAATVTGLPALSRSGVPRPTGAVGGLKVLDWAGLKAAVTYTFDDGLVSQTLNYPKLQATGVRMTFFLNSNASNAAVWTQAAREGHELGNHTAHHCNSGGTSCVGTYAGSLGAEYDLCTEYIKQMYGVSEVWTTASPYGDTGFDEIAKTRFFLNRGVSNGQIAPNDSTDSHNLPIYGAAEGATAGLINASIDATSEAGKWQILLFHSLGGDGGYAPVQAAEVIASIEHAKSAGDIWVDSMVNIGAYWAGQKAMMAATSTRSGRQTVVQWTLPPHFPPGKYVRVTVTGGALWQQGIELPWNNAGYYEVALDPGSLTIAARK